MTKLEALIQGHYGQMSGGRKRIASYLLANEKEFTYLTSKEVAGRAGVSESTVVRFAYFLGFKRYKDLQEYVRNGNHKTFNIIDQFKENTLDMTGENPYMRAVEKDIMNIQETFINLDAALVEQITEVLMKARHIGVVSVRGGLAPALLLQHFLQEFYDNAFFLFPGLGNSLDQIKSWGKEDVVVCFEYTPTKQYSYTVLKYAKERGCKIISIVSELAYTIKELSDYTLEVKKEGTYISYTSSVVMVNVLIDLIGQKDKERIMPKLEETFKILKMMDKGNG